MRQFWDIWTDMHKITHPGEYGLGNEPESFMNSDAEALKELAELVEELSDWEMRSFYVVEEGGKK